MTEDAERKLPDWIADHLRRYRESDGADGHIWHGLTTLLLTTRGRRTGRKLTLPLIYGKDGERYIVVASKGGAPQHPGWYLNLTADPEVELQVGAAKFQATARTASPEEKPRLWRMMNEIYSPYDEYQAKTGREIPVVILEPR